MSKQLSLETEQDMIDVITERPYSFKLNGKFYFIYHPSLGKSLLIQKELSSHKIKLTNLVEVCYKHKMMCCRILAYSVLCNRRQLFNEPLIKELTDEFYKSLDLDDMSKLMYLVKRINDTKELEKSLGINADDETKRKIAQSKDDNSSSIVFGGNSVYGTLIDAACQRYGWRLDYLLWEISFANVHFMMKDAINSVYLTEDERKRLHIRKRGEEVIDASNPKNNSLIAKFFKG